VNSDTVGCPATTQGGPLARNFCRGYLPSLWRCGRIRLQRDAYSCSVSIKTIKDKTVSLMILNGELSDWYFLYPSGGADRGGVATPQIANDIAIGEDAFKNREDKPLAVTVLYHTITTKLQGAGFHTPPVPIRFIKLGGPAPVLRTRTNQLHGSQSQLLLAAPLYRLPGRPQVATWGTSRLGTE
jgi:hypothetical protein